MEFMVASGQYMQFLDLEAKVSVPVAAAELEPNHKYAVLMFLQNNDVASLQNVMVSVSHQACEDVNRGLSCLIVQPGPVDLPGRVKDAQGVVMVRFMIMTPSSGSGRLNARVVPSGPEITQPIGIHGFSPAEYPSDSSQATA